MKFSTIVLPFAILAGRAFAAQSQQPLAKLPPGCLLSAVNTQDEPSDLASVCGNNAKQVQQAIASLCKTNVASQAQAAFIATCSGAGKSVAAYTPTATGNGAVTTDSQGRIVSQTSSGSSPTHNAAPVMAQGAASGYVAVVVAIVAVAAY